MTKDEMVMELMELLKANGRPKQAADVFEAYQKNFVYKSDTLIANDDMKKTR